MGQVAQFSHGSTTWLALGGLIDIPGTMVDDDDPRAWRRAYKKTIDESLSNLARFSSRPLTTVIFGNPDSRVRTVIEAIDDRFGDRAQTLLVNIGQASLEGFVDQYLQQDPSDIVAALPDCDAAIEASSAIPGHEGPVIVGVEDQEWIRELADLVDTQSGTSAGEIDDVGRGFLRGRQITWFELSLGLDAIPGIARDLVPETSGWIALAILVEFRFSITPAQGVLR